jgi:hypothetical protein
MRELHSGVANRQEVVPDGQKASTPIGQTLRVRAPSRFRRVPPSPGAAKHEASRPPGGEQLDETADRFIRPTFSRTVPCTAPPPARVL